MSTTTKRKALDGVLQRRVRARREDSEEIEDVQSGSEAADPENDEGSSSEGSDEEDGNEVCLCDVSSQELHN